MFSEVILLRVVNPLPDYKINDSKKLKLFCEELKTWWEKEKMLVARVSPFATIYSKASS